MLRVNFGCFFLFCLGGFLFDNAQAFVVVPSQLTHAATVGVSALNAIENHNNEEPSTSTNQRRSFMMATLLATSAAVAAPKAALARYVMDEETGEYVSVEDVDWQTEWKQRLDKASTMSQKEIFEAGRGAGNVDLKNGSESDASKKRRAMSACRDPTVRAKIKGLTNEKACTARVFGGEVDFMLEAL